MLTKRQKMVVGVIESSIKNKGIPPTRAEIAEELAISSSNAVQDHLKALERKGVIKLTPKISRGIHLTHEK